ncbi:SAM-dependent methyltransferase [Phaeacidiphilus oryzae]|uniref:SAM-dependent methyltransferase n=1 Tax=Phaeacidiphilus oryzae TaxID=348818 RepID=UPI00055BF792|nr:SAM-dependent methyltransferase [Phaeacidiphilus oryzae]
MTNTEWMRTGPDGREPVELRTDVPHSARMYDYYLGGKDNFPADRAAAERFVANAPSVPDAARANRRFLGRAVRFACEQGISRFLDVGTGIPTAENTHEVAQSVDPAAQVVYVDNDPIVLAHARALLSSKNGSGSTAFLGADFRDPEAILSAPATRKLLEPGEPVCLMMVALLHFFADEEAYASVRRLTAALPDRSLVVLSHLTSDFSTPESDEEGRRIYREAGIPLTTRSREEVEHLLADSGLTLLAPGVVPTIDWRPGDHPSDAALTAELVCTYAAVAAKD